MAGHAVLHGNGNRSARPVLWVSLIIETRNMHGTTKGHAEHIDATAAGRPVQCGTDA